MSTAIEDLEARGFDRCSELASESIQVRCSQCAALVINGVPCHETGCPNQRRAQRQQREEEENYEGGYTCHCGVWHLTLKQHNEHLEQDHYHQ